MKNMTFREKLLAVGMGLFLFAAGASAVNLLALPYARTYYGYPFAGLMLSAVLALVLLAAAARYFTRLPEERAGQLAAKARPAFLVILFAAQLLLGYLMEYTPSGDNFMLYDGSQLLAREGSFTSEPGFGLYLARFSNQWGFVLLLTLLEKLLFAAGISHIFFPLVVLQAALYTLGMRAALNMARRLRGARGECMLLLLLTVCLPLYLSAAVLYTDTFSLPFILLALDFALRVLDAKTLRGQLGWAAACGLVVLLGGQIKMTTVIVLIAALIVWLLRMKPVRAALCGLLCTGILLAGMSGVHAYMLDHVIDPDVYAQQNTPVLHWVMMAIPTSDNPYGTASGDYGITWEMMDAGASHEAVMDSIYTRMRDRIYTLRYPNRLAAAMCRKDAAFMGDGTFGMTEMLDDRPVRPNAVSSVVLADGAHYGLYSLICTGIWAAELLFALYGVWDAVKKRDFRTALPVVAVFGVMLFLMLWEARSRYLFGFVPVMLLLAACGALDAAGRGGEKR